MNIHHVLMFSIDNLACDFRKYCGLLIMLIMGASIVSIMNMSHETCNSS